MSIFIFNNFEMGLSIFSIFHFTFLEVENPGKFSRNGVNFEGSEKIFRGLFFFQSLIFMITEHVNFHCQYLLSKIIHVCDMLF